MRRGRCGGSFAGLRGWRRLRGRTWELGFSWAFLGRREGKARREGRRTSVMKRCSFRFVRKRCIGVPSLGNVFGYLFVFCAAISSSEREGP